MSKKRKKAPVLGRPALPEGEALTAHIHVRCTDEQKAAFEEFAAAMDPPMAVGTYLRWLADVATGRAIKSQGGSR